MKEIGKTRSAFTLVELLVAVGIVMILVAIFLPYLAKVRETSRREQCNENLRSIYTALTSYANSNKHLYPAVEYDAVHNPNGYVAYTGADASDPFARGTTVKPNDVTASLFLLVRDGLVPPQRFVCPSSSNMADPLRLDGVTTLPQKRSNFTSGKYLSYSYSSPFSSAPVNKKDELFRLDDTQPGDFALLADKNPGVSGNGDNVVAPKWDAPPLEIAQANSRNHRRAGQNVLYADGHVQFQSTPYCGTGVGAKRDNIYTALTPVFQPPGLRPPTESNGFCGRDMGPAWANDSYLVPTEQE